MGNEREGADQEAGVWEWMHEWFPDLPESIVGQDFEKLWLHLATIVMSIDWRSRKSYR